MPAHRTPSFEDWILERYMIVNAEEFWAIYWDEFYIARRGGLDDGTAHAVAISRSVVRAEAEGFLVEVSKDKKKEGTLDEFIGIQTGEPEK